MHKPKTPGPTAEETLLRSRQVDELARLDEDENRRLKVLVRGRTSGGLLGGRRGGSTRGSGGADGGSASLGSGGRSSGSLVSRMRVGMAGV